MDNYLRGAQIPSPRFRQAPLPEGLHHVRGFHNLQTFFPTLSKLYRLSKHQTSDVWLDSKWRIQALDISGTSGPCVVHVVPNADCSGEVPAAPTPQSAFLKVTHLLDPIRWMRGNYSLPKHTGLPWHSKTWTTAWMKLQDPWNQAYVETLASYALGRLREEGVSPHFNLFYGAFCARADTYRYNMTDEYGSFRNARWFWSGQRRGLYSVRAINVAHPTDPIDPEVLKQLLREPSVTHSEKEESVSSEEEEEVEVEIDVSEAEDEADASGSVHSADAMSELEYISEEEESPENSGDSAASSAEDDDTTSDSDSDDEEYRIYAEFHDFPVMLIAVEENRGTMDSLLENPGEVGARQGQPEWEERWSAWLFQVAAALSVAQSILGFTHNDLHTNNIVWTETAEEYFYYTNRAGAVFRVPTFGKLFRIIDFGRSIFRINQNLFVSDDFRSGNDADGQYCFKPLHPRPPAGEEVSPNPSFDLCRLAVSLLDSLFPNAPEEKEGGRILSSEEGLEVRETVSPLYNMIWSWLIDDDGRNVLIEPDGDERFPDFDLYKHIAAKVHGAIPARQFTDPALDRFQVPPSSLPQGARTWPLFC